MVILFGKSEYFFSVHYTLSRKKMTPQQTDYAKADVMSLKTKRTKWTHQKQRVALKNQELIRFNITSNKNFYT